MDRIIKNPTSWKRNKHFSNFQFETRGRRGSNPPLIENEDDWWALGQHHGLKTPLLDWTESPFVALYFAVVSALNEQSNSLVVFAFYQDAASVISREIKSDAHVDLINKIEPKLKIIKPLSDENNRLVSQRGLFTRGPNNMDMETWVKKFNSYKPSLMVLIKIIIPAKNLQDCLTYLNRMNINHSTLFPDLTGASNYCNNQLEIDNY